MRHFDAIVAHDSRHDIEANLDPSGTVLLQPRRRRAPQTHLFLRTYRLGGCSPPICMARLHLTENDEPGSNRHEVDLDPPGPIVPLDVKPLPLVHPGRDVLTGPPEEGALVHAFKLVRGWDS